MEKLSSVSVFQRGSLPPISVTLPFGSRFLTPPGFLTPERGLCCCTQREKSILDISAMSQVLVANNGPVIGQCCDKCQELLREIAEHEAPGTRERTTILFHSIQTLISSADDCHLCNLILSELDPEVVQYQLDDIILHPEHALNQMTAIIPPYGRSGATSYNTVAVLQESHLREGIANHIPLCYLVTKSPESSVTARESPLYQTDEFSGFL